MTKETYDKISDSFNQSPKALKAIRVINLILTISVYISYPVFLLYLFLTHNKDFLRITLVPLISFIVVTIIRKIINRPRPYEVIDFNPVIKKDKRGESMPSRHIFSVFIIAFAFLYFCPILSVPFFIIGALMSVIRVVGGVHFISDVIVAILISLVTAFIGFYII